MKNAFLRLDINLCESRRKPKLFLLNFKPPASVPWLLAGTQTPTAGRGWRPRFNQREEIHPPAADCFPPGFLAQANFSCFKIFLNRVSET